MSNYPLPDGWIQQYDSRYSHPFWVDTRTKPPRAIWVHPYEDEQFLAEHPEIRAKEEKYSEPQAEIDAPPSYDAAMREEGSSSGSAQKPGPSKHPDAASGESSHAGRKRGTFGRLKDKAIGTKEEREEQKRIRAEQAARAKEQARQDRMRQLAEREAYMRAYGGYAPYHPSYDTRQSRGFGGDNPALLLLGGLVGGVLLGDIFGGGF